MVRREVLDETAKQNFERRARSDALMKALISRIVNNSSFIAFVAAFLKQRATNAIEEELNSEQKVSEVVQSPPDWFPSASVS